MNCDCHQSAEGHAFHELLRCESCGTLWSEHQQAPVRCPAPLRPKTKEPEKPTKFCRACNRDKPVDDFNKRGAGRQWRCRVCQRKTNVRQRKEYSDAAQ